MHGSYHRAQRLLLIMERHCGNLDGERKLLSQLVDDSMRNDDVQVDKVRPSSNPFRSLTGTSMLILTLKVYTHDKNHLGER